MVKSVIKKFKQFGITETLPWQGRKAKLSPRTTWKQCHEVNIKPWVVLDTMMYRRIDAKNGEAFVSKNIMPTLKHGGSSMIFWGCFSSRGTGKWIAIRGLMKSEDYIKTVSWGHYKAMSYFERHCQTFWYDEYQHKYLRNTTLFK